MAVQDYWSSGGTREGFEAWKPPTFDAVQGGQTSTTNTTQDREFDWGRLNALQQEYMAPGIGRSERAMQSILAQNVGGSPFARAYAGKQALQGFGESLAAEQAASGRSSLQDYLASLGQGNELARQESSSRLAEGYGPRQDVLFQRPEPKPKPQQTATAGATRPAAAIPRTERRRTIEEELFDRAASEKWDAETLRAALVNSGVEGY